MKRWIQSGVCALLAAALLTSLTGCGGKETDMSSQASSKVTVSHSVDVIAEATAGKMTGSPVYIGQPVAEVKKLYQYTEDGEGPDMDETDAVDETDAASNESLPPMSLTEGETMVRMATGEVDYYYRKAQADKGIAFMAAVVDVYGFEIGITMPDDVKNAILPEPVESVPAPEDFFFLPETPEDSLCLTYQAGTRQLDFYFVDEFLAAVTLSEPQWWAVEPSSSTTSAMDALDVTNASDSSDTSDSDRNDAKDDADRDGTHDGN